MTRELETFNRRMAARRNLASAGVIIVIGLLLVWKVSRLFAGNGPIEPAPPGIEIDITRTGEVQVHGCTRDTETCVREAWDREWNRPGGARAIARVTVAEGAPQNVVHDTRALLLAAGFTPAP